MDEQIQPTSREILNAAFDAVLDREVRRPVSHYRGPALAAYLGIRQVLDRHLERARDANPNEFTLGLK